MNPAKNCHDTVELVELSSLVNSEVQSSIPTRWERKQQQQQQQARSLTPKSKQAYSPCKSSPSSLKLRESLNNVRPSLQQQMKKKGTPSGSDRFIPSRSALDFENASYRSNLSTRLDESDKDAGAAAALPPPSPGTQDYQRTMQHTMNADANSRILAFKKKAPMAQRNGSALALEENPLAVLYSQQSKRALTGAVAQVQPTRVIPGAPSRILDAPGLLDDFYINPLDWSVANQIAVALGPSVYLWNASSGQIDELMTMPGALEDDASLDHVSSLKFVQDGGSTLAVGSSDATVALWDVERSVKIRTMKGHASRVSTLSWNQHILTSGGRDSSLFHHDVRVANHIVATLQDGHVSEVCQAKWNDDGTTLATGGNDNAACLWDLRQHGQPRVRLTQHQAAVKALAWCPYQRNVLASGGGTSDRTIKIWNTVSGTLEKSVDTGSQVCSLVFNPNERELLSSHGFSNCELSLWKFPTMGKVKDLSGHTSRVLHMAVSPDGSTVCSAAADESLRFWEVFGAPQVAAKKKEMSPGGNAGGLRQRIR